MTARDGIYSVRTCAGIWTEKDLSMWSTEKRDTEKTGSKIKQHERQLALLTSTELTDIQEKAL